MDNFNFDTVTKIEPNSFDDRAYGCILGAFSGDACGSYLKGIK